MANIFEDWSSMAQGISSGGGMSSGPLGASGAVAGVGGGIGAAGLGLSAFGTISSIMSAKTEANLSKQEADISGQNAALEQKVHDQKQQAMVLSAKRSDIENYRKTQQAKSLGLTTAANQGAQFGSGEAGAQGAATAQGAFNALGISQNLEIGKNIFSYDDQISQNKIKMADLQSQAADAKSSGATASGLSSLGGSLLKSAPMLASFIV